MKHIQPYTLFEKMGVPDAILPYVDQIYDKVCIYLDKYLLSGSKKDYGKQIEITFNDTNSHPKYKLNKSIIELLIYKYDKDDKMAFQVGGSFIKNQKNSLKMIVEIYLNSHFVDRNINDLKYRIKQVVQHELLHSYEEKQSGGKSMNKDFKSILGVVASGKDEVNDIIYRSFYIPLYQTLPHEIRAKVVEASDISSTEELNKSKIWFDIKRMENFNADKCYRDIKNVYGEGFDEFDKSFGDKASEMENNYQLYGNKTKGKSLKDILFYYEPLIKKSGEIIKRKILKRIGSL